MKKIYLLGTLLFSALSFGQFTDDFAGTGSLNANGWTTHSSTGAGQLTITTGSLSYSGITTTGNKINLVAGNTEDLNRSVGTAITTISYYSTIVNFSNTTGLSATGDYSITFCSTVGATAPTGLYGRLFFKTGVAANTFNVGLVNTSGTGTTPSYLPTDFPVGTPLFVVVKYDRATNTANLFLNPALNSTEPAPSLTNATGTAAAPPQIAGIALRQAGNATTGTGNVEYDYIRAADNWAYVTTGTSLGIQQNEISGLRLFPNPAKDFLYISSDNAEAKQLTIYDVVGKVVVNTKVTNGAVNVSALNRGVYMAKVIQEGKTASRKLVIE
jgi:hypothetical protein